ncbi:hypothetical protein POSPLADRAFT_1030719 [Postia placenta MAD-698-R-SB12]|uniref:Uncharacterized protein n=1 Tax=Postia placenta MAD-698-R-SB12 TaxID=670580 RepID=A0A1X6NH17_9APHY|nr:hypothetical protein POSPLADRAFT_1030719 [Postia placenta MAD-698-R-SB12]OSX67812.1 hypothetical protein POSPLADRAFT_1030719 [Postia placenta MAD-698-R-SB12]
MYSRLISHWGLTRLVADVSSRRGPTGSKSTIARSPGGRSFRQAFLYSCADTTPDTSLTMKQFSNSIRADRAGFKTRFWDGGTIVRVAFFATARPRAALAEVGTVISPSLRGPAKISGFDRRRYDIAAVNPEIWSAQNQRSDATTNLKHYHGLFIPTRKGCKHLTNTRVQQK